MNPISHNILFFNKGDRLCYEFKPQKENRHNFFVRTPQHTCLPAFGGIILVCGRLGMRGKGVSTIGNYDLQIL